MMPKTWTSGPVSEFELAVAGEVKAWMGRRGLSARQLADKIGMAHSALSKRLRGVSAFTINDLGVIAAHMGITLGQLLGPVVDAPLTGEDTENPAPVSPERGESDEDVRPVGLEPTTHGLKVFALVASRNLNRDSLRMLVTLIKQ
ncbi:helix-turn-helix domain-containing protein [Rothia nasimurium]|uniref:helix-turn-helix domain-containing protein n=1 Tax=Rothia nasimurium TaxID=85336 RepID=UPI001F25DAB0|nr:helix-turn-helix transcriptional regulator [Rothia nasimurium]